MADAIPRYTLEHFKASRRCLTLDEYNKTEGATPEYFDPAYVKNIILYARMLVIEQHPDDSYLLILGNMQYDGTSLEPLEAILYDAACKEGIVQAPYKIPAPQDIKTEADARAFYQMLYDENALFYPDEEAADQLNMRMESQFTDEEAAAIDALNAHIKTICNPNAIYNNLVFHI